MDGYALCPRVSSHGSRQTSKFSGSAPSMAELSTRVSEWLFNFIAPGIIHLLNVDGTRKDHLHRTFRGPYARKQRWRQKNNKTAAIQWFRSRNSRITWLRMTSRFISSMLEFSSYLNYQNTFLTPSDRQNDGGSTSNSTTSAEEYFTPQESASKPFTSYFPLPREGL